RARLGLEPRVIEVARTDGPRATAEKAGSAGDVGARGPLHENPGRVRPFAVHRQSQIRAALTTEAGRLIEATLAGGSQGLFRRTGGSLNEADHLRLRRVVAHRKPLHSVDVPAGAAFHMSVVPYT